MNSELINKFLKVKNWQWVSVLTAQSHCHTMRLRPELKAKCC